MDEQIILDEGGTSQLDKIELLKLCAFDTELYCKTFFPKTFRQKSPDWAPQVWLPLENPDARLVNLILFRGAAKTTRLRTFASKRIAFGTSRTILYVGASERDAIRSVQWLRGQVERNTFWRDTFGLAPGKKWEETQIEIEHRTFGHTIWVLAAGITGSLRGINFDDYRPDLIVIDDPQTDEMASNLEQRNKLEDLLLGAVRNSLAPVVDEPNAKIVIAATPQHRDDVTQKARKDLDWTSVVIPCWTPSTINLDVEQQESSWPERYTSEELRKQKRGHIRRNKLSIFTREWECRLTSDETSQFLAPWLNIRERGTCPQNAFAVLAIDPVPPPSDREVAKGLAGKDWEVHHVWGVTAGNYHLLEAVRNRGHDPSWSIATALGLARKWRVARIIVESVAYQRVLKWHLEQEMRRRRIFYSVIPYVDKRSKFNRITSTLHGLATHGKLWVGEEHSEFVAQFTDYPNVEHDDDLDAAAIALSDLANPYLEPGTPLPDDDLVEEFEYQGGCP